MSAAPDGERAGAGHADLRGDRLAAAVRPRHVRPLAGPADRRDDAAVGRRPAATACRDDRRCAGLRSRHRRPGRPRPAGVGRLRRRAGPRAGRLAGRRSALRPAQRDPAPGTVTCSAARCSTCPRASCRSAGSRLGGVLVAAPVPARHAARPAPASTWRAAARRPVRPQPPAAARGRAAPRSPTTWRDNARLWSVRTAPLRLPRPVGAQRADRRLRVPLSCPTRPGTPGCCSPSPRSACWPGTPLTGRFVPQRWRERLGAPLRLLLAAPVPGLRPATRRCRSRWPRSRSPRSATRRACCSRSG